MSTGSKELFLSESNKEESGGEYPLDMKHSEDVYIKESDGEDPQNSKDYEDPSYMKYSEDDCPEPKSIHNSEDEDPSYMEGADDDDGRRILREHRAIVKKKYNFPILRSRRQDLSLKDKIKILQVMDAGPKVSQRMIADMYQVSQSQVSRIQNQKAKILRDWKNGNVNRKRNRMGKGGILEEKLLDWHNQAKLKSLPTSGPILMEKAKLIAMELNLDFRPTSGWFGRWKTRNGIRLKDLKKPALESYSKLCAHWRRYNFTKATKSCEPENIWYLGHTNMYYNALALAENARPDYYSSLKSIDVILAFNSTGIERKLPLVVGEESLLSGTSPVIYHGEGEAITPDVFGQWLTNWDKDLRASNKNIVVFLQKSPYCVQNLRLSCIALHFYPDKDEQSHEPPVDPFEHDIITSFKALFRYQIHTHHLASKVLEDKINSNSASIPTLLDSLHMIKRSWEHINPDVLVKGIVKAGLSKHLLTLDVEANIQQPLGLDREQFDNFVNIDEEIRIKLTSSVTKGLSRKSPLPTDCEILSACKMLRRYIQTSSPSYVDAFDAIEAAIHQNVIMRNSPNMQNNVADFHPLYSPSSIHSKQGLQNTINKRKVTHGEVGTVQSPPECSKQKDVQPTFNLDYSNVPNGNKTQQQMPQEHQQCNYFPNSNFGIKNFPMTHFRAVSSMNADQRYGSQVDLQQHQHQMPDLNQLHPSENNASNAYLSFASQF